MSLIILDDLAYLDCGLIIATLLLILSTAVYVMRSFLRPSKKFFFMVRGGFDIIVGLLLVYLTFSIMQTPVYPNYKTLYVSWIVFMYCFSGLLFSDFLYSIVETTFANRKAIETPKTCIPSPINPFAD